MEVLNKNAAIRTLIRMSEDVNYHENYIRRLQRIMTELEQAVQASRELRESWKR